MSTSSDLRPDADSVEFVVRLSQVVAGGACHPFRSTHCRRTKLTMAFKRRDGGGRPPRKKNRARTRSSKKDPIFVDGVRPRPMYVDYKDIDLLKKLVNRHGRIVGRRKSGCNAASQHAVTKAIKRARFMALLPYVGS